MCLQMLCAGSLDTFQVFVWSVKTGRLLEALAAHEGPVTSLSFSPVGPLLATASWDHTVRTWDIFRLAPLLAVPSGCPYMLLACHQYLRSSKIISANCWKRWLPMWALSPPSPSLLWAPCWKQAPGTTTCAPGTSSGQRYC